MQYSAIILGAFAALAAATTGTAPAPVGTGSPAAGNGTTVISPTLSAPSASVTYATGAGAPRWDAGMGAIVLAIAGAVIAI